MVKQSKIQKMAQSDDNEELLKVVELIYDNIIVLPDKKQAWDTLIHLIQDYDSKVHYTWEDSYNGRSPAKQDAAYILGSVFPHVPDKEHAQEDIHQLAQDNDSHVRMGAAYAIGTSFQYFPDKKQAWEDLHRLTQDKLSPKVRRVTAKVLGLCFPHIPDKNQAWEDLHRLTEDEDVEDLAIYSLGVAFPYVPNKKEAWDHLHQLLEHKSVLKSYIIYAIGIAFPYIPDRQQAWEDLHQLTNEWVYSDKAAEAIGIAFPYIPDKKQAWEDLYRLAESKDYHIVPFANYSLGRASIFKATEAESEEDFRKELKNAMEFFENSLESYEGIFAGIKGILGDFNHAKFCLSFYRAFYTIIFEKQYAEVEVKKYLADAKSAVEGSESKEKLLEAVENLSNALKEMQKAQEMDYKTMKCDFNAYRRYCERSADLLNASEDKALGVTKVIRMGLLIIDERIKAIITEIQKNAEELCKNTKNTPLEELGKEVNRIGANLLYVRDPIGLEKNIDILIATLSAICARIPEEEKDEACYLLKKAKDEQYIEDKLPLVNVILSRIPILITHAKKNEEINKKLDHIIEYVQKIESSCNQIISNLEKSRVKLKEEEKEELKSLTDDLKKANEEQLKNFGNELIERFKDSKHKEEIEKVQEEHKPKINESFSKIKNITSELGMALCAAITAEKLLPYIEKIMHQITILSDINPGLASTLILILITIKKTLK